MIGWMIEIAQDSPMQNDLIWATPEQLRKEYALPTAFRAFLASFYDASC